MDTPEDNLGKDPASPPESGQEPPKSGETQPEGEPEEAEAEAEVDKSPVSIAGGMVNGHPALGPNEKKGGQGKLLIVILVIVLLLGSAAAAYYFYDKNKTKTTTPQVRTPATSQSTASDTTSVASKLESDLAQYKVATADIRNSDSTNSVYYRVSDSWFNHTASSASQLYKFGKLSDDPECDAGWTKFGQYFDKANKAYADAGYTVFAANRYTQSENCQHSIIAFNDTETCSVMYGTDLDMPAQASASTVSYYAMNVSCKPLKDLTANVAEDKKTVEILDDLGLTPSQLIYTAAYIKDSKTSDYKIALLKDQAANMLYYYKKSDGKWTVAYDKDTYYLLCSPTGANADDIKKAFASEVCYNATTKKNAAMQ